MSNNLFVSFQLEDGRRSSALILAAIEELGHSLPVFRSLWYVRSNLSAAETAARLRSVMDERDHLVVIDACNNEIALLNVHGRDCATLEAQWHRELKASTECSGCVADSPRSREVLLPGSTHPDDPLTARSSDVRHSGLLLRSSTTSPR